MDFDGSKGLRWVLGGTPASGSVDPPVVVRHAQHAGAGEDLGRRGACGLGEGGDPEEALLGASHAELPKNVESPNLTRKFV